MSNLKAVKLPFPDKQIKQTKEGHGITSDTQFLVNTILNSPCVTTPCRKKVFEIGTGNGIIAIMLALSSSVFDVTAVEVQISQYILAMENKREAGVDVNFRLADIRNYHRYFSRKKYDIIVANPPYFKAGTGRMSQDVSKNISRFELLCDINDIFRFVGTHLEKEGMAFILYPDSRYQEIVKHAEANLLTIEQQLRVSQNISENESNHSAHSDNRPETNSRNTPGRTVFVFKHRQ